MKDFIDNTEPEWLENVTRGLATITLNRPNSLNALNHSMMIGCAAALDKYENDPAVKAVCFKGAGERSFCAGGDIKAVYREGRENLPMAEMYFYDEYRLNRRIYHYSKPVISYMDGIVMGGGYGIAGPSRFRVTSERTVFAMPEVGIGLFPDVGSMYSLTRCPGLSGLYLALTGYHINAADMLYCGLAEYYVPTDKWQDCEKNIENAAPEDIKHILERYGEIPDIENHIEKRQIGIDQYFNAKTIEEILQNLDESNDDWAVETAGHIRSCCPMSVKITLMHYWNAKNQDFDTVTGTDFTIVQHVLRNTEFYEGVRALLIDKDKTPHWKPETLERVMPERVKSFFYPTGKSLDDTIAVINR